jgi:hypothetical protein
VWTRSALLILSSAGLVWMLAEDELELGVELQIVFAAISLFCAVAANASWRVDDIIKVFE